MADQDVMKSLDLVDVQTDFDPTIDADLDWDGAIALARAGKRYKMHFVKGVQRRFGAWIAELSRIHAVEHGGISKFASAIGMNYATIRQHRSRYLAAGEKRSYTFQRALPLESESPGPVQKVSDSENVTPVTSEAPKFTDMFDNTERSAAELEPEEEEKTDAGEHQSTAKSQLALVPNQYTHEQISLHARLGHHFAHDLLKWAEGVESIIVTFEDGHDFEFYADDVDIW